MEKNKLTIGADPEFFLKKEGKFVPAIGLIGGDKTKTRHIEGVGDVLEDNVMVEFNIEPASTAEEFAQNTMRVIRFLRTELPMYEFSFSASALFDTSLLTHPKAVEFGCDPDYNAYTLDMNVSPDPATLGGLRFAGGHIHVGYSDNPTIDESIAIAKAMDLYLGVPALLMDLDDRRREYYGKPGTVRPKSYGVEYRSLSNFWLQSPEKMKWAFSQTERAVKHALAGFNTHSEEVKRTLLTKNRDKARQLFHEFDLKMV